MAELRKTAQVSVRVAQRREREARQKSGAIFPHAHALFFMPAARSGHPEYFLRPTPLDIFGRKEAGKVLTNNLVGSVALNSFSTGIPTDNLASRIHHKDCVILDSIEKQSISFFAFPESLLSKAASPLYLRQMLFRSFVHASVSDRRRHRESFCGIKDKVSKFEMTCLVCCTLPSILLVPAMA